MTCSRRQVYSIGGHREMPGLEEVLASLEQGKLSQPSVVDFVYTLHQCRKERNLPYAMPLHACMQESGLEADPSFGNHLVSMLVDVGCMYGAQQVFDRLVYRNEVSWHALITGYIKRAEPQHALILYKKMQQDAVHPSAHTYVALLKACAKLKDVQRGREIHAEIANRGLLERDLFMGSSLVDMYAKCGSLAKAQEVFDKLPVRDAVSWNALIAGYAQHGLGKQALQCFDQMQLEGICPNAVTFICSLKACGSIRAIDKGQEIHVEIARKEMLKRDLVLGSALVDMYAKCGSLAKAQEVFDKLPVQSIASWNALIAGYAKHGCAEDALKSFEQMQCKGILPDAATFVCSLKACGSIGATGKGRKIHAEIARSGLLERDHIVGNALVDMYAKCGLLAKAQEVFDKLPARDVVSWNALISGYAEQEQGEKALNVFEHMQLAGITPNAVTFVCSLKACASIGARDKGQEIHAEIARKGMLERDLVIGSALVDMYAKCGLLEKAHEVFDKLPVRGVISWTALIAGYAKHECGEEALNCFEQMQSEGVFPNAVTFVCSLKACGSIRATGKGREIHAEIVRNGWERDLVVGSALVNMYAKCGLLPRAQEVFDKLPVRSVVLWNTLMAGYANHELGKEALNCFEQMQLEGISPNAFTYVCSLKACGSLKATDKGREIHAEIARKRLLERDLVVGNALVDMYAKCGLLAKAQEVFDKFSAPDVVSWTALIAGYAEHECSEEALNCFNQMQLKGVPPNAATLACSLKACGSLKAADNGGEIHSEIARKGLEIDLVVGNALVDMYAKCGLLEKAQEVFDKLPDRGVVSWTALIAGYAEHGFGEEALNCFEQMQLEGVSPNAVTFVSTLKACGSIEATDKGQEIHAEIARVGLLERDFVVGSTLVDMYAKCGLLARAKEVFVKLPVRDAVSWNSLIAGYAKHGCGEETLNCLEKMQLEGVSPDAVTFICCLKACGSIGSIIKGQEIHAQILKRGLLERDLVVGNALVDMYAKCGLLTKAEEVLDKLPVRDVVSWNALIAGYVEHGCGEEALNCISQMQLEGVSPNAITFVCSLKACGSLGATKKGREIHAQIARMGLEGDHLVGSSLVDMYAKCGLLAKALEVFDKLPVRDTVLWNALIAGYAQLGECENVFHTFYKMIREGQKPDLVTFINVLNACSCAGLVGKGQVFFEAMSNEYGITPTLEHYACMVDLLGRAGELDRAVAMIKKMPFRSILVGWHTVLGACQKWGNGEIGRQAFEHAVGLAPKDAAAYDPMFNIYTDGG